jgi:hypothetical protein
MKSHQSSANAYASQKASRADTLLPESEDYLDKSQCVEALARYTAGLKIDPKHVFAHNN